MFGRSERLAGEETERNAVCHGVEAICVAMQMIAAVVGGQKARRVCRVAYRLVNINNRVEIVLAANPFVHRLPHLFALRRFVLQFS